MLLAHISPRLTRSTQAQNSDTGSVRQNTPLAPERNEAMTSSRAGTSSKITIPMLGRRVVSARAICSPFLAVETKSALITATSGLRFVATENSSAAGTTATTWNQIGRAHV